MENQQSNETTADVMRAVPPPAVCSACDGEGLRLGPVGARAPEWVCDTCGGSGINDKIPPCMECGAMTPEEAETRCVCSGNKDHCHGCDLWQNNEIKWWGYLHQNGNIQVKRWFGDHKDYTEDCRDNEFVVSVVPPFPANSREEAIKIINSRLFK